MFSQAKNSSRTRIYFCKLKQAQDIRSSIICKLENYSNKRLKEHELFFCHLRQVSKRHIFSTIRYFYLEFVSTYCNEKRNDHFTFRCSLGEVIDSFFVTFSIGIRVKAFVLGSSFLGTIFMEVAVFCTGEGRDDALR